MRSWVTCLGCTISIHSLHTEGDAQELSHAAAQIPFQSTPSTRRETTKSANNLNTEEFQSTPSTRRETNYRNPGKARNEFQSTPSTRRETQRKGRNCKIYIYFNPLPPHGGRPSQNAAASDARDISIHSLHTEGDAALFSVHDFIDISIHSLHTEGDLCFLPPFA